MKVCLVTEYFYPEDTGGTPTILANLMRYLQDHYADLEIDVITSDKLYRRAGGKLAREEDWDGIRIHRVNSPRSNRPSTALRLLAGCLFAVAAVLRLLRAHDYDLIFLGTNPPAAPVVGRFAARWWRIPYCYLIHDLYPDIAIGLGALPASHPIARLAWRLQRTWLHRAGVVCVLGRCMRAYLARTYDVPEERVRVIPNWSDPQAIAPMPTSSRFRAQHALTGFLVVYGGNLGKSQGLGILIDTAELLRESHQDITIVLVGSGDAREELAARISAANLTNIRLFPSVGPQDYPDLLTSADISLVSLDPCLSGLAVPSKFYNLLSAGRPIIGIVDRISEVAQVMAEFRCGIQVDHGDARQLADAVIRLHDDAAACTEMGANARRVLLARYTIAVIAEEYYHVFSEQTAQPRMKIPAGR